MERAPFQTTAAYIAPSRLRMLPRGLRFSHEYCFFLHDQMAHLLTQYEDAGANTVTFKFSDKAQARQFSKLAKNSSLDAMRSLGFGAEARRVIINQITMAMVSDCLHHIYEALRCLEKRKMIVALNLLRKPLTDSLTYLSWMLGDEDAFYQAFTDSGSGGLTSKMLGNRRTEIIQGALDKTEVTSVLTSDFIRRFLFDRSAPEGLYRLFQRAIHLITAKHVEIQTEPENFNFIFKSYADDDIHEAIHYGLPHVLLFLSHVVLELYERMQPMDPGAKKGFEVRSILGLYLLEGGTNADHAFAALSGLTDLQCGECNAPFVATPHNTARALLSESYRCPKCRMVQAFPLSWMF